jgi:hypothetical protein
MSSMRRRTRLSGGGGTLRFVLAKAAACTHNVVKQVSILAELADQHARDLGRVLGNANAALRG